MTTISDLVCQYESTVQFDKEFVSNDFIQINDAHSEYPTVNLNGCNFGIINLKIKKTEPIVQKRHIVFSIDCSGSMSGICDDGKSKMEHTNHTLINMITYFAEHPELMVSISVFAFDGTIYNIIVNKEVTEENLDKLIQNIKKIRPKDMTNIEIALVNSAEYIKNYIDNNSETYVSHILMTDGDATQGKLLPSELKEVVSSLVSNIFIGFGIEHNAYLLKELSSDSENKYYFVDALEKAGFVYGEILHSIIYRVLENTSISVNNGLIYDWKKNRWVNKIDIGDLVSESNKIIHVLSENPSEFLCVLQTTDCISKKVLDFSIQNNVVEGFVDLTEYKYRQKTQQLLFEVNAHNFNIIDCYNDFYSEDNEEKYKNIKKNGKLLKERMKNLLNEMKCGKGGFMKVLCDDIYICLQTFETKHSAMYSCARQISQGAQRSYSATYTPTSNKNDNFNYSFTPAVTRFKRSHAVNFSTQNNEYINDCDSESDETGFEEKVTLPLQLSDLNDDDAQCDAAQCEEYDMEYTVSEQTDNPNSTISMLKLMRSFSASVDDNKLFR